MNRTLSRLALPLAVLTLSACAGLRDALTAHVDVVARAGSQELTVERLAQLLGNSEVPLTSENVRGIAGLWVNYQLLAHAAAKGDTLATPEAAAAGMWFQLEQRRVGKYYEIVSKEWGVSDTASYEKAYNDGVLLAAQHILLAKQPEGLSATANDSIKREAERIAATVNARTFASVVRARSEDPGSKDRAGSYGVFSPGTMVPEFDAGIRSVPPGGISQVVETQYGYHIIRRHTWDEIKEEFSQRYPELALQRAESTFQAQVAVGANVQVKPAAARIAKSIANDPDLHRDDRTVVATSRKGNMTAARLAQWVAAIPSSQRLRPQIAQAPDSIVLMFVRDVVRNELMLKSADSAGLTVDSADAAMAQDAFYRGVSATLQALNLSPASFGDSASDAATRERIAAGRIDDYMTRLLRNETNFVDIPEPIVIVLRDRFESRISAAGVDRALAAAERVRTSADSTRAATQPPSAVPLP